jgi:hypothetical protein
MAHESIEQAVHELGRGVAQEAVVIGSQAIRLALPEFRQSRDTDVAVSPGVYDHLRQQPGWQEVPDSQGVLRILNDDLDVGRGWGGTMTHADLLRRSWQTDTGIRIASLPDIVAYKHRRGSESDVKDLAFIRSCLQDPGRAPLPARLLGHEVAAAQACLPEELRDDPDAQAAILLAASGMHIVYTLYGHPEIGQANQIVGDLERQEFGVPATYHNGFGLVADAQRLQRHLHNIGAPARDRLLALAIDPHTDSVYGFGRRSDNPTGHDELRSAELVRAHALYLGFDRDEAERMYNGTIGTTFDERAGSQLGKDSPDPLVRGVVGVDLQPLAEPTAVETTVELGAEDLHSARYSRDRVVGRVLRERGVRVFSTLDVVRAIDRYGGERPRGASPDSPTAMQAFAGRLGGNAGFLRAHRYPRDWTLDNPAMREAHAVKLVDLEARLLAGEITAEQAYEEAVDHTADMRAL